MRKMVAHLGALAMIGWLVGCGASRGDRPLTPAEKDRLLRAAQAEQLRREASPDRCGLSARSAQVQARVASGHQGADAFDSTGCPPRSEQGPRDE